MTPHADCARMRNRAQSQAVTLPFPDPTPARHAAAVAPRRGGGVASPESEA